MGGGKSSGSQSNNVQLTPEQIQTINLQNSFLQSYLPTLTNTAQGAQGVYQGQINPVNQASSNAINTANTAGNIQGNVGANALMSGTSGLQNASNSATATGQGLTNLGSQNANYLANQQAMSGLNNANLGSSQLANLFSPQYEQQQVAGALVPAEQAAQRANVQQEAGFAGAGESGSARDALAAQQTQALNAQTMGGIAAQTEAGIESQQAQAANSLLSGGLQGQGMAGTNYANILNAGNTLTGQGLQGYTGLTGAGTTNLGAAPGTIGSTINYAETPLSNYGQYASLIYGAPQQTPNYSGTQSSTGSTSGKGAGLNLNNLAG
jgi:hypothetical protein